MSGPGVWCIPGFTMAPEHVCTRLLLDVLSAHATVTWLPDHSRTDTPLQHFMPAMRG
jgi:hypothetical protein